MSSEFERMRQGKLYNSFDDDLVKLRLETRKLTLKYNQLEPDDTINRQAILKEIFKECSNCDTAYFEPNIRIEYGNNIVFGKNFYMNFDCMLSISVSVLMSIMFFRR